MKKQWSDVDKAMWILANDWTIEKVKRSVTKRVPNPVMFFTKGSTPPWWNESDRMPILPIFGPGEINASLFSLPDGRIITKEECMKYEFEMHPKKAGS